MKILLLGGTIFVGRHLAEAALRRGHAVTIFHRGRHEPPSKATESVRGDRHADLDRLGDRAWDAIFDTSAYHPKSVDAAIAALGAACGRYVLISTINVYADFPAGGGNEDTPVAEIADHTVATLSQLPEPERGSISSALGSAYGPLKARCERVVLDTFGDRAFVVRPGVIAGPHDPSGRLAYWIARIARGGRVLAPGTPDRAVRIIDARDLADWIVASAERGLGGVFNATGAADGTMVGLLEACAGATRTTPPITWVDEAFLAERGVMPWQDLPLWLSAAENPFFEVSNARAVAAGLRFRPLATTAADTLAYHRADGDDAALAGYLSAARESELLAAFHAQSAGRDHARS